MAIAPTIYWPRPRVNTAEDYYQRRAAQFTGLTDKRDVVWRWNDFYCADTGMETVAGVGGSVAYVSNRTGGAVNVISGAGAITYMLPGRHAGAGAYPSQLGGVTGTVWYGALRIRVVTAPAADGWAGLSLRDTISADLADLTIGVTGSVSTTKFSVAGNGGGGANVLGTTTIDTAAVYVIEAYRTGAITRLLVNEVAEGTPADVFPSGAQESFIVGSNGGTAVNGNIVVDWYCHMSNGRITT